jgi:protein-S-isoprenylcysteine O-methyltransferase Ste14
MPAGAKGVSRTKEPGWSRPRPRLPLQAGQPARLATPRPADSGDTRTRYPASMEPFVGNDTASMIFAVVFGGWVLFEIALTARKRARGVGRGRDRGSAVLVFAATMIGFIIMANCATSASSAAINGHPWIIFAAGIVIALGGIALRLWSIRVLGRSFTTTLTAARGQVIVNRGPYHFVRHPSYAGALITLFGAALCFANWLSLLAVVPAFLAYAYRIRLEEAVLEEQFGEAYRDYRERTARLVPFVF